MWGVCILLDRYYYFYLISFKQTCFIGNGQILTNKAHVLVRGSTLKSKITAYTFKSIHFSRFDKSEHATTDIIHYFDSIM